MFDTQRTKRDIWEHINLRSVLEKSPAGWLWQDRPVSIPPVFNTFNVSGFHLFSGWIKSFFLSFWNGHDCWISLPSVTKLGKNMSYSELTWGHVLPDLRQPFSKVLLGYVIITSVSRKKWRAKKLAQYAQCKGMSEAYAYAIKDFKEKKVPWGFMWSMGFERCLGSPCVGRKF